MRLRFVLLFLLLASLLALIVLLPRSPLVLGWLWNGASDFALEEGYTLRAERLSGNALAGVTIRGLHVSGPGVDVSASNASLRYGLFSLVLGRPTVALDLSGIRGQLDPTAFSAPQRSGNPELPINLQRLTLEDIQLSVSEYDLILPEIAVTELNVATTVDGIELAGQLNTPDGAATFSGIWQVAENLLELDIIQADVRVARYWWDGATGGNVSGQLRASADGVELDAFIEDGSIDYLEVEVQDISGPVTMRDLIVTGELTGRGLDGQVQADIVVDVPALHYRGTLTGNPRLEGAVPWLGRNIGLDLDVLPAAGPMELNVLVSGWYETQVTGQASGAGSIGGLPLEALSGDFGYTTSTGVSVEASGLLAGGSLNLQLRPGDDLSSSLQVRLVDLQPFAASPELRLDGRGTVHFDSVNGQPAPSNIEASLQGPLLGESVDLLLQADSTDTYTWLAELTGTGFGGQLAAEASLDFEQSLASGSLSGSGLELPGLPWQLDLQAEMSEAALDLPLPVITTAEAGPLHFGPLLLNVAQGPGRLLEAAEGSLALLASGGTYVLELDGPPLEVVNGTVFDAPLSAVGQVGFGGGQLLGDLALSYRELDLQLAGGPDGTLDATIAGPEHTLNASFNTASKDWQAEGSLPVIALGELLGLQLAGDLQGNASGTGGEIAELQFAGDLEIAGQETQVQLLEQQGELLVLGSASLLGQDWQLEGSIWPRQELQASSGIGTVSLAGGQISGQGELTLPAGIRIERAGLFTDTLQWQLNGNLAEQQLQLATGSSNLRLAWQDGLVLTAALTEQLVARGLEEQVLSVEAGLDASGTVSGQLSHAAGVLQIAGQLQDATVQLTGALPAAVLSPLLAGQVAIDGSLGWQDELNVQATADWLDLTADLGWTAAEGLRGTVRAEGLEAGFDGNVVNGDLNGFDPLPYFNVELPLLQLPVSGSLSGTPVNNLWQLDLIAAADPVRLEARGQVSGQDSELQLLADLADGLLRAEGQLSGPLLSPRLEAQLSSQALEVPGLLNVPAQDLRLTLDSGGNWQLTGAGADLTLADGNLAGSVTVDLELLEVAHSLSLVPRQDPSGLQAEARLSGPLLQGDLQLAPEQAVFAFELVAAERLAWLEHAQLTGAVEYAGDWTARLSTRAAAPFSVLVPLTLGAELAGDLTGFSGHGNVRGGPAAERLLTVQATGGSEGVTVSSDLASFAVSELLTLFGLSSELHAEGLATLQLAPSGELDWQLDGALQGAAFGSALNLELVGSPRSLQVGGSVAGEPLVANLELAGPVSADASWAGLELALEATAGPDAVIYTGSLLSSAGSSQNLEAGLNFTLSQQAGNLSLDSLDGPIGPLNLELAGSLLPETQVQGSLETPWLAESLPVNFHGPDDLRLNASALGLTLNARWLDGSPDLTVQGQPDGQDLQVDLGWNPGSGFRGAATGQLRLAGLRPVQLEATGDALGNLQLTASTRQPVPGLETEVPVSLSAQLAAEPWRPDALSGSLNASLNLAGPLPFLGGRSLSVSASGRLEGSLLDPQLSASVVALGAVEASGRLNASRAGAELNMAGTGMELLASARIDGWQATLQANQLELPVLEELLPGGRLTVSASGRGDWSVPGSSASLEHLRIEHASANVTGTGSVTAGLLNADLELQVPLAALSVGSQLTGDATGSVSLERLDLSIPGSGVLAGLVNLTGVGVAGYFELDGSMQLQGTTAEPWLSGSLSDALTQGQLEFDWQPASERFQLASQLQLGAVSTDLQLLSSPVTGQIASGSVGLPGGSFELGSTTTGNFQLLGSGLYSVWAAEVDPAAATLEITGDLSSLEAEATGQVRLNARLAEQGLEFTGGASDLSLLGLDLGEVTVSTLGSNGGGLQFSGSNLQGRLSLSGEWQLGSLALEVWPGASLVASGAGNLQGGSLNASLAGRLLDQPVTGTLGTSLGTDGLALEAELELLTGRATMAARHAESGWQGQVELTGLSYAGLSVAGSGTIHGSLLDPTVELQTDASLMGLQGRGSLAIGSGLLDFHQTLSGGGLEGPVVLQGSISPEPELRITGPDGRSFRLNQARAGTEQPLLERPLVASGSLDLQGSAAHLALLAAGEGDTASITIGLPLLDGLSVNGEMRLASLREFLEQLDQGVQLSGRMDTFGSLHLSVLAGSMELDGFGISTPVGIVEASGSIGLSGDSRLSGSFTPTAGWLRDLPALAGNTTIPFALLSSAGIIRFVSSSSLGDVDAAYQLSSGSGSLTGLLRSGGGNASLSLSWSQAGGLGGQLSSEGLVLFELPGGPPGLLNTDLTMTSGRVSGSAELSVGSGRVTLSGTWGLADLLPVAVATRNQRGGNVELRVGSFELSELPAVARYAPALSGGVTAVVQFRDGVLAGNLVASGLNAAGSPLPMEAIISGSLSRVEIGATVTGSPMSLTLENGVLAGLLEMRRFPLHTLAEALAGPLDATAEVTGVARFSLPLGDLADSEVRVATEQVRFERSGVVTSGNVSLELRSGVLEVSEASFSGAGYWEAGGVLRADELDFSLQAVDADFGPMLGLIPTLNQLGVAAAGTISLEARGSLADPQITFDTQALDFTLAGIAYRLEDVLLSLRSSELTVSAELLAHDTIQGRMSLSGSGGVSLSPLAFQDARFGFGGSLVLPFIGPLEDIRGAIYSADGTLGAPLLTTVEANLGNTISVSGSLAPLDLHVSGQDLQVDLPSIFLVGTRLNTDLNLRYDQGFVLSGGITIVESELTLNRGTGGGVSLGGSLGDDFRFDSVRIEAPARLRLAESFGTGELSGGITVSGTLSEPVLAGRAEALRGTFQFGGRDFELQEAIALFDPTRGLYPEIQLTATTSIDRNRLLPAASNLRLVAPTEGQATVTLSFAGTIEPDDTAGVRLNLDPVLSSNVLVQPSSAGGFTTAARPLTEEELLALITLGRTEFASIGGESGLAPTVAQGALETAVDMLILSELQRALGEALGLELVEIRSSAISNLLSGGNGADQQFGISLRFGGYVSEDVFATYRVSAFDDPEGLYAFSNELGIRYALGPVILNLAGSLNLPEAPDSAAVAQLSLAVLYEINPVTSLEAAFDLSSEEQQFRFGVTWRW